MFILEKMNTDDNCGNYMNYYSVMGGNYLLLMLKF